jgi:hypothetical protein
MLGQRRNWYRPAVGIPIVAGVAITAATLLVARAFLVPLGVFDAIMLFVAADSYFKDEPLPPR